MLIGEYLRVGISLQEAVDQTAHLRAGGTPSELEGEVVEPSVQSEAEVARQNEKALKELQMMMGGLGT